MNELISCPRCGKETNIYAPSCEHCHAPIERKNPSGTGGKAPERPAETPAQSGDIEAEGRRLHRALAEEAGGFRKCPFCAEEIRAEAVKCRFCGERVPASGGSRARASRPLVWIGASLVVALLLAGAWGASIYLRHARPPAGISAAQIAAPSAELKADQVKADYVKRYVTLSGIGTLDDTGIATGAPTKYLYGTVANAGGRLVIKLEITVYYFDAKDVCIAEGAVCPVLGTKGKPDSLKPNASKEFRVPLPMQPPGWSGKIRAKISDIEFAD